jgi:hypothetical protein
MGIFSSPLSPSLRKQQAGHPFDVILQKVPASHAHKAAWDARIQQYADHFPEAYVVDLPTAVRQAGGGTFGLALFTTFIFAVTLLLTHGSAYITRGSVDDSRSPCNQSDTPRARE